MSFKLAKSRSLVLKKEMVTITFCFSLGITKIPSLTEEPVKSLEKVFNRLEIILTSVASKQVILMELTALWEKRMEETTKRKKAKYAELVEECQTNGCRVADNMNVKKATLFE